MFFSSISIITDGWMSVVLNSVPHPSSRKKHIDISSSLKQPTASGDFSTPATLNMDLSEHRDRVRNEWPDFHHPKVSDCIPASAHGLYWFSESPRLTNEWGHDLEPKRSAAQLLTQTFPRVPQNLRIPLGSAASLSFCMLTDTPKYTDWCNLLTGMRW